MTDRNGNMLSLALEIEGLILLLQRRGDLVHPEVNSILRDKINELAALAGCTEATVERTPTATDADAQAIYSNAIFEERQDADITPAAQPVADTTAPIAPPVATADEVVETVAATMPEPEATPELPAPAPVAAPEAPAAENNVTVLADTMPKFTLNDKFLFRKELFDGDDSQFQETLATIASMGSRSDVEEYLYDDLCLDPSDEVVKQFVSIVCAQFK